MSQENPHKGNDASLPDWLRARDVLSGEDAVKAGGEKCLPRLDSQTDEEFLAYRKRAAFFNATAFVNQADKQLWHPQYSVSDYEGLPVGTLDQGMPDSFQGAIAISYN